MKQIGSYKKWQMVANGFVITFVDADTDDFFTKLEECKLKLQRLDELKN